MFQVNSKDIRTIHQHEAFSDTTLDSLIFFIFSLKEKAPEYLRCFHNFTALFLKSKTNKMVNVTT